MTTGALSIMMLCPECVSVMCTAPGTSEPRAVSGPPNSLDRRPLRSPAVCPAAARRCRLAWRAPLSSASKSEADKNQQFHEDVFHGCSPFASIHLLDVRQLPQITPSIGRGAETLMQSNCEINDHGMPGQSVETQAGLLFVLFFAASPAGR